MLDDDEVAAIRAIGDNTGSMALKGAGPDHEGDVAPRPLADGCATRRGRAPLGHRARARPAPADGCSWLSLPRSRRRRSPPPSSPLPRAGREEAGREGQRSRAEGQGRRRRRARRFLLSGSGWPYLLVPFIPIAIVLELAHADAVLIFAAAAAGVIPTAALMGRATEELAHRAGPGIGGLLNVTFGNAPELIIAFFALNEGLQEVVKASLIGSILGNILLVMGAAMLVGGLKRERQTFNATAASVQSSMLLLAAVALVMPTIFQLVSGGGLPGVGEERVDFGSDLESMSLIVVADPAVVLRRRPAVLAALAPRAVQPDVRGRGARRRAVDRQAVGADARRRRRRGRRHVGDPRRLDLRGVEHDRPERVLRRPDRRGDRRQRRRALGRDLLRRASDKMDLAVNIAIGSSAQIALFAAPVLVLLSFVVGPNPMALVFNGFELGAVFLAILIANHVTHDGESTWYEGVQLLAVYAVLGVVFFYA